MHSKVQKKALSALIVFFLASTITFSLGLHSIQLEHVHFGSAHASGHAPGADIISIDEYVHGTEKKFFIFLLFSLLLAICLYRVSFTSWNEFCFVNERLVKLSTKRCTAKPKRVYDYLASSFSDGILNPKPY